MATALFGRLLREVESRAKRYPMKSILFFSLFLAWSAFADIAPGTYTYVDRYGIAPSPDESIETTKQYTQYLSHTKKGGTLHIHHLDPFDLIHPDTFVKGVQSQVAPLYYPYVFEDLMQDDIRGNSRTVRAHLAKSFTLLPDGVTFQIDLRDDVHFSDGSLMTAEDILNSWKVNIESNGVSHEPLMKAKYGDAKLEITDKFQFRVRFDGIEKKRLREAIYWFVAGFQIVKENKASSNEIKISNKYIGTGPYQYIAADRKDVKLQRREDYWNKSTPLYNFDLIQISSYRDISVVREAFMSGGLNVFVEERIQNEAVLDSKLGSSFYAKHVVEQSPENVKTGLLYMNMASGPTRDLKFRQAMTLLYDAEPIFHILYADSFTRQRDIQLAGDLAPHGPPSPEVSALFKGDPQEDLLNQPYETAGIYELNEPKPFRQRLGRAIQLLREAGYVFQDGVLTKNGQPVELMATYRINAVEQKSIVYFASTLAKIGIKMDLRPATDSATFVSSLRSNQYNFAFIYLDMPNKYDVYDFDNLIFRFGSGAAVVNPKGEQSNVCNMQSKLMDSLTNKMSETDAASPAYRDLTDAALRYLSVNVPYILIGEKTKMTVYTDKKICLPPVATARYLEAAFMSPDGSCP